MGRSSAHLTLAPASRLQASGRDEDRATSAGTPQLTGGPVRLQHAARHDPDDGDTMPDTDTPTSGGQTPGDSDDGRQYAH